MTDPLKIEAPVGLVAPPSNRASWAPKLRAWHGAAQALGEHCGEIEAVEDNEAALTEARQTARTASKRIDEMRLYATKPYRDMATFLNGQFNKIANELKEADSKVSQSIRVVLALKEERRAAERVKREAEHARLQEEMKKKAAERMSADAVPDEPTELLPDVDVPPVRVESALGSETKAVQIREVEIYDVKQLPRAYLTPNVAMIKRDVLAGADVSGARIKMREILQTRKV